MPVNNFKTDPFRDTLGVRGFSPIFLILHASCVSYNFFFIIFALCDLIEIDIHVFVFLVCLLFIFLVLFFFCCNDRAIFQF